MDRKIGVVGCGLMGSGIAEVSARAGCDVVVAERDGEALALGRSRVERSLERGVKAGKLSDDLRHQSLEGIRYTTDLAELSDRTLVVEAVLEDPAEKMRVFSILGQVVKDPEAVLASNTSSIPVTKLATATERPETVIGIHFFNPVPVMNLVELVPSLMTNERTIAQATEFAAGVLGKRVIRSKDRAGFIVNALLIPYLLSAIRMFEAGFATAEDIDAGMIEGCSHPIGPLALTDLIGLDTTMAVAESLFAEFKEALYAPPPLLARMVEAGFLGRKTGTGFYSYPS
jgi:3-hydroxybutyryl-CoA dehydrogenase